MPFISVIIPSYNRKDRLRKALVSVLAQTPGTGPRETDLSLEAIVIDDGSVDGTREMIEKDFTSVRYFYQANLGPAAARNRGIEQARGAWIAFLDSDDEWLPGKLQTQLQFFQDHPDYLIHQTQETWIRNGQRVNPMKKHQKFGGWIFEKCLPLCLISPSAVMIHRKLFDEIGLFDESLPACEDYDLWLRITCRYPVGLSEKSFVIKTGGHADQRSHEFPAMDRFRIYSLKKILASGTLNAEQTEAAQKMLEEKERIFNQGAAKRAVGAAPRGRPEGQAQGPAPTMKIL